MANIHNHIFIHRLANTSEDAFLFRREHSAKTILADKPLLNEYGECSEAPKTHPSAIRQATTYANFAMTQETYIKKAKRTGATAYYVALADWFCGPKVLEINVDNWTGEIGQTILVKARDNLKVARVSVVIRDAAEKVLETGEAVQTEPGSTWWKYTTHSLVKMTPFPIVEAMAQDLAGNSDSFVIS
jgi:hypothetical protein